MFARTTHALAVALAAALLAPAAALAAPAPGDDAAWWEDWRPDRQDESYAGEQGDGAWFDDVQDGGDALPGTTPAPPAPTPTPTPATGGLRAVPYRATIIAQARRRGLEAAFVAAIIRAESGFNPRARSPVGARGLMQLMPATARSMGARVSQLYDPQTSITYGTLYLAKVRAVVGASPRLIAAGYNAGPGAVTRYGGVPPYAETQAYVQRVMGFRAAYRSGG